MKRALLLAVALATIAGAGSASAVSDGTYTTAAMHCSGAANNVESPARAEEGCHNATVTIGDVAGHEYFGIGSPQTASREQGVVPGVLPFGLLANVHKADWWVDGGTDCRRFLVDLKTPGAPAESACPWFARSAPNYYGPDVAPAPASGLTIFFGFDDNTAGGEHDSSELVNNGPSDGGGIRATLDPASVAPWVAAFVAQNPQYVLTHPLPLADAGLGFCADGICMSVQTQRHVAFQGGDDEKHRDVSDYAGKRWDPTTCSGDDDGSKPGDKACDDPGTEQKDDITYWHNQEGTTYVEPGVQIYEDPDPQGSPLGGQYPIPALYIGTCGVVVGGGAMKMPASPYTNPQTGQLVLRTACG
jgi:hypothetical protein